MDYLRADHTLDDVLMGFSSVSREQAEGYLDMTLEAARQEASRAAGASRR